MPRIREKGGLLFLAIRPNDRPTLATTIEALINLADAMEGDPDLEPALGGYSGPGDERESDPADEPHDDEIGGRLAQDAEPSLGWPEQVDQERRNVLTGGHGHDDREEDASDMPEGDDEKEDDRTDMIGFGWANDEPDMPQEGLLWFNPMGRASEGAERRLAAANSNSPSAAEAVARFRELPDDKQAYVLGFTAGLLAGLEKRP